MSGPTISVITVTRNLIEAGRRQSMLDAMDCVQGQSCRDLEHIVWDGGSDDGTQALIAAAADAAAEGPDPRPVRIVSEPDTGLYEAMNKAVAAAQGEYVLFLNSDDLIADADSLARMQAALALDRADFAFGSALIADATGRVRLHRRMSLDAVLQRMPFNHNAALYRREMFGALGGHDLQFRVAADYDMILRMVMQGHRGIRLDVPVARFRAGGISANQARTGADYACIWRKNYAPLLDMERYSQAACEGWYRAGALPARVPWAILRNGPRHAAVRRAARHSLTKSLRRSLQPWRRTKGAG